MKVKKITQEVDMVEPSPQKGFPLEVIYILVKNYKKNLDVGNAIGFTTHWQLTHNFYHKNKIFLIPKVNLVHL